MKRILLLSDTHGYLDDAVLQHAAESDEVWHAGDVGSVSVIEKLETKALVRGVYGNVDDIEIRLRFGIINEFICEDMSVLMTHIGGYPGNYNPVIEKELLLKRPQIFISGHSHILKVMPDNNLNLLHLNPGAIGLQGFHVKRTMLRFEIDCGAIKNMAVIEYPKQGKNIGYY